jgi:hypothetical protein
MLPIRCAAVLALALCACHRKSAEIVTLATPTPRHTPAATPWLGPLTRATPAAQPPGEPMTPPQPSRYLNATIEKLLPPQTPAAASAQAAELLQRYQTEKEWVERSEVVARLASASTPQSRETLRFLFFAEQDLEMRIQMVMSLPLVDSEDFGPSIPILQEALKAIQPRDLRDAALDAVQALNEPRAIPILEAAITDPDPELRVMVMKTLEYLRDVQQINAQSK